MIDPTLFISSTNFIIYSWEALTTVHKVCTESGIIKWHNYFNVRVPLSVNANTWYNQLGEFFQKRNFVAILGPKEAYLKLYELVKPQSPCLDNFQIQADFCRHPRI